MILDKDVRKQEIDSLVKKLFEGEKALQEVSVKLKMAIANGAKEPDFELFQRYKEALQIYKAKAKEKDRETFITLRLLDTFIADVAGEWPWNFIKENMDIFPFLSDNLQRREESGF